jgi:hypothetical protein
VIDQIQPAILKGAGIGLDLSKGESVKRAWVLVSDLHNYLVLTRPFFHRDYLCRNRAHQGLMFSRSGRLESRCLLLHIRFPTKMRSGAATPATDLLDLSKDYFFAPRIASFAAFATRNLTTVLAGVLIFCGVFGLVPVRAFLLIE